jgi:hypothetical protein
MITAVFLSRTIIKEAIAAKELKAGPNDGAGPAAGQPKLAGTKRKGAQRDLNPNARASKAGRKFPGPPVTEAGMLVSAFLVFCC